MKVQSLFEMPVLINKDLNPSMHRFTEFYSEDTIERDFTVVWRQSQQINSYCVIIAKDKSLAVWGIITHDPNRQGVVGIEPLTIVDFKDGLNIKSQVKFDPNTTLQVDLVQTSKRSKNAGFATDLYIKLASVGFTIVSDTEQWIGGKQLWKRIANTTASNKTVSVYVLTSTSMNTTYDGHNIPDEELWSDDLTHKHTLFVLQKNGDYNER